MYLKVTLSWTKKHGLLNDSLFVSCLFCFLVLELAVPTKSITSGHFKSLRSKGQLYWFIIQIKDKNIIYINSFQMVITENTYALEMIIFQSLIHLLRKSKNYKHWRAWEPKSCFFGNIICRLLSNLYIYLRCEFSQQIKIDLILG